MASNACRTISLLGHCRAASILILTEKLTKDFASAIVQFSDDHSESSVRFLLSVFFHVIDVVRPLLDHRRQSIDALFDNSVIFRISHLIKINHLPLRQCIDDQRVIATDSHGTWRYYTMCKDIVTLCRSHSVPSEEASIPAFWSQLTLSSFKEDKLKPYVLQLAGVRLESTFDSLVTE
uniref:Uncharacterized protein n=1 Tax=Romanomermis culicivorax TaxID=13658 RepID=A0A915INB8_ROMCU